MNNIPIIGFAAYSGTGKTTLIEQIVRNLKSQGYRIAVIKHDAHQFEIDKEGKDSWRFSHAGADMTILSSREKTALIEQRELSFADLISMVHDVDLILVEGYKQENIPRIGISRKAAKKGLPHPSTAYIAVVTDDEAIAAKYDPVFYLDDIQGISEFIKKVAKIDQISGHFIK